MTSKCGTSHADIGPKVKEACHVQQMDFGGSEVQGVAFIDDKHLAVTPQGGNLLIMNVDSVELADTVRASLTRSFTATECSTYGIEPCPTLEEMRAH